MKKRLSLLMVLMMIVSLLPMSAFAAAKPYVTVSNVTTADKNVKVVVTFELDAFQDLKTGQVQFDLKNAKFQEDPAATADPTFGGQPANANPINGTTVFFGVAPEAYANNTKVTRVFQAYVDFRNSNDGDVTLTVNDLGNTGIGSQDVKIAVVKDVDNSDLAINVKDAEKAVSFDGGKLSQFEIKNYKKLYTDAAANAMFIELNDEFTYDMDPVNGTKVFVDGVVKAPALFAGRTNVLVLDKADIPESSKVITVMPVIKGLGRSASVGKVDATVRIVKNNATYTNVSSIQSNRAAIGKVVDYSVTMTIVEKGKKEIPAVWGGDEATVTVTLKGPKGSILGRDLEFTAAGADVVVGSVTKTASGKVDGTVYKDGQFNITNAAADITELKFDMKIKTDANKDGVATLTVGQRGWEVKADLAKVTPKFSLKTEVLPVKKGEARDTANVVITEAKAGLLGSNDKIQLRFDTRREYTQFTSKSLKVEATNGMTFGDPVWGKVDKDSGTSYAIVEIPVKRTSSGEAAVITVSGIRVLVDGSATDDMVKVQGRLNFAKVAEADYIKVVKEYALESILTVFTIGQAQYTVNKEAKTAAAAPYIKNGRTMLPVRALAESLGLTVQWNSATKTATFTDDTKVAGVVIGAQTMYVNGTPVKLSAPAELVNGTTFIELRSLATVFGVQIDWDAAAKTATVSK